MPGAYDSTIWLSSANSPQAQRKRGRQGRSSWGLHRSDALCGRREFVKAIRRAPQGELNRARPYRDEPSSSASDGPTKSLLKNASVRGRQLVDRVLHGAHVGRRCLLGEDDQRKHTVFGPYSNDLARPGYIRVRFRIAAANFGRTIDPVITLDVLQTPHFLQETRVMLGKKDLRAKDLRPSRWRSSKTRSRSQFRCGLLYDRFR